MNNNSTKGQVTMFIIAGIIIVAAIVLLFVFRGGRGNDGSTGIEKNPEAFLETCLEDSVYEGIDLISLQGGFVDPQLYINFKFDNEPTANRIGYLCYTRDTGNCMPSSAMIFQHIEEEISEYVNNSVEDCFDSLAKSLDREGFIVNAFYKGFDVDIAYKKIIINVDGEIKATKSGQTSSYKYLKTEYPSSLYEILIFPVQEIIEAQAFLWDCYFDQVEYERYNPEFNIKSFTVDDGTEIYTIIKTETSEDFRFAVRSCARGAGYP